LGGHQWARANLGFVSAYVLYRQGEAAVVDTGVAGSEGTIEQALESAGLGWGSVGHVILTHKHNDHQGSLEAILGSTPAATWYAGAGDMGSIISSTTGSAVGDGDVVFGLEIIESPGHTPGHISVLDPLSGILVVGDSVRGGADGGLAPPNPQFSEDMALAAESVRKMAGFDYEVVLVGHGDPVLQGGASAMTALAASLG
jgi:glyoxylase-like metal-dependent hydrolase (beta-lactamase superfamily II)